MAVELRLGTSARGLILVSAATILGGCGVISWEQYTNPLSLYYMLGLGVCMLGVYVLFRSQLREHRTYNLQVRFAQIFCALGWGMVLVVAVTYAKNWQEFIESGSALYLSYRNFAATILLTTLPMPFYLAGLKKYHLLSAPVFMAALLLTGQPHGARVRRGAAGAVLRLSGAHGRCQQMGDAGPDGGGRRGAGPVRHGRGQVAL